MMAGPTTGVGSSTEDVARHTVASYDVDVHAIRVKALEMEDVAAKMMMDLVDGGTTAIAQSVIAANIALEHLQREVEEQCVQTIVRRQPLAIDLCEIVSAIRISSDLERVGDLAENIAERVQAIDGQVQRRAGSVDVDRMNELVVEQLRDFLEAYGKHDRIAALDVWRRDDSVDAAYTSLFSPYVYTETFQPTGQRAIIQSRRHPAIVREGGYTYGAVLDRGG
jgi:phosphate transport system protein